MMNAGRNSAERESEAEFKVRISVGLALTLYCIFSVCKKKIDFLASKNTSDRIISLSTKYIQS